MPHPRSARTLRVGAYLMRQKLKRREKFPLDRRARAAVRRATSPAPAAARSSTRPRSCASGCRVEQARRRDRGVRRADGVDRRRRAADAPRDRRRSSTSSSTRKKFVYLCTNARAAAAQARPVHAVAVLRVGGPRRRPARAPRRGGRPRGRVRRGRRGDPRGQGAGLPGHDQHDVLQHRHAQDRPRRARLPQRRARGRRDDDLAGLRLREGARPGALPRRRADPAAVPRRRSPTAGAGSGGSTTRRCSSTSSRARSTSSARRGASRATRCSAGSARAT